jgi:hypothetical protein
MPNIIGTIDQVDTKLDWLLKFSVNSDGRTLWLGCKHTKPLESFVAAAIEQGNVAPDSRPQWEIEYTEETSTGKDGKTYDNRYVQSAHMVAASAPPSGGGGGSVAPSDREAAITRAVGFKGAIDILRTSLHGSSTPPDDIAKVGAAVNSLTNMFEAILLGTYNGDAPGIIIIDEDEDPIFEETV